MPKLIKNEIAILFGKDTNNCVIVTFYEAHGQMVSTVEAAGLPAKASGKSAITLTGKLIELCRAQKMTKRSFVANKHTYWAAEMPLALVPVVA